MECLFRGQRQDTHEWVCGFVRHYKDEDKYFIEECIEGRDWKVIPETVGEYTGVTEFDLKDDTINKKIFEGDIVEIIVYRDVYGQRKSQYDSLVKVRGVVKKYCARWFIDLENDYNKFLFAAKGKEVYDRDIPNNYFLDNFYLTDERKEWERQTNPNYPFNYIKVIGNIFDNPGIVRGKTMSKYKRLTNKYWKEHYDIFEDVCCDTCAEDCGECERNFNALVRLAELEDKIENGKLVELPFIVIDKKTKKEADEHKLALKEDWAKGLCYCDTDGFAITQDGMLILLDECGKYTYCPDNRFEVVAESELEELQEKQK